MDHRVEGLGLGSISEINALPREMAEALYLRLVPPELLQSLDVDPDTLLTSDGQRLVRITAPADKPWARVEVRTAADARDPVFLVDVEMSPLSVPELAFVHITDPAGPRYGIDLDAEGRDTLFATSGRNVDEEIRAMKDGLAPGQVRRGRRMLGRVLDQMERFCRLIGNELYLIEPLFYHSAILYERRGCGYLLGREVMEEIHAGFADGGPLRNDLDGSSPFRQPSAADSVRGRSWALHDGVGGREWGGIKMYKAAGRHAGVSTFPGGIY
ncbi:MAG: hypothetical protein L0027_16895 [Candidatus Rokubacteria bacterium]|nr:hypothetical protein [Candidatus Rokubacteria bacterium]